MREVRKMREERNETRDQWEIFGMRNGSSSNDET